MAPRKAPPPTLAEEIARRVKELRAERSWSQAQLAEEMHALGFPWTRMTVTEIEGPRRRTVSVEELFGLAYVFDVGIKRLLGVTVRVAPSRGNPDPNLVAITQEWAVHRRDASALMDSGRRSSAEERDLELRLSALRGELAVVERQRERLTDRYSTVMQEITRLTDELGAARTRAEE